jgi:hypothetical protein
MANLLFLTAAGKDLVEAERPGFQTPFRGGP